MELPICCAIDFGLVVVAGYIIISCQIFSFCRCSVVRN
jgi:hypothetical protein